VLELDFQNPNQFSNIPEIDDFQQWAEMGLLRNIGDSSQSRSADGNSGVDDYSIVIRISTEAESQQLNNDYRQKNTPTNVLSFPFEMPDLPEVAWVEPRHLGDLIFCEAIIVKEAAEQNKTLFQHWAHLVIHGMLHLQGFDHINDGDAVIMESREIHLLDQLGFPDPYQGSYQQPHQNPNGNADE